MIFTTVLTFLLTLFFMVLIIENATKLKLIDRPNERSSHNIPKPRGAGIAIFLAFIITSIVCNYNFFIENIAFFTVLGIVFITGILDDRINLRASKKFILISLAVTLLFFTTDLKVTSLGIWFGKDLVLPPLFSLLFTIFVIDGFTNALNLIDGLDGLAGGISFIIFSTFLYLGINYHDQFIINISIIFLSSLVAFLLFNWYPAKIFLGDSGSLLLGFIISVLSIKLIEHINTVSVLFLAALPILDTIIVMVRRMQRHKSPFKADKSHLHHKILTWKTKVDFSVMLLLLIQVSFSLLGILTINTDNSINILIYILLLKIFFYVFDERKTPRNYTTVSFHQKITEKILNCKYRYSGLLLVICIFAIVHFLL